MRARHCIESKAKLGQAFHMSVCSVYLLESLYESCDQLGVNEGSLNVCRVVLEVSSNEDMVIRMKMALAYRHGDVSRTCCFVFSLLESQGDDQ
jgi:hypothetical protein